MSKELVISANRHETRVALIEDDQLVEVYFQRANEYSLAGSVHKGRVTRVLPGMQSAFVDVGLDRDTFLYVSDFLEEHEDFDRITDADRPARQERGPDRDRDRRPPPPPVAVHRESPVREAPIEAAVEPPVIAASSAAPALERNDDRGERRGRRSRRRRGRSGGFPDSKYAADTGPRPPEAEAPVARVAESREVEEAVPNQVPLILPGESLAKYRGGSAQNIAQSIESAPSSNEIDPELDSEPETDELEPVDPLGDYPPENALPDAPVHVAPFEESLVEESIIEVPALSDPEPSADVEAEDTPAIEESFDEPLDQASEEAEPAVSSMFDDEEDRDIQAMILEHAEGIGAFDPAAEDAEGVESGEGDEEVAPEAGSEVNPQNAPHIEADGGTAAVRERGGRFQHRVSRRSRRRSRGGAPENRGEARPDSSVAEKPAEPKSAEARPAEARPAPPMDRPTAERTVTRPVVQQPSISDLLKEGQEIIVQIAKEPLGQKGARITSHIALPGRYVVYMPTLEHMGVSRKISSDEERMRLKRILQSRRPGPVGGFITRTAAEGRTEEEIAGDMAFLYNLWQDIRHKADKKAAPVLLHHDLDIVQRILRDQLADSFKAIWIDNEDTYESVLRFVERFQPALVPKVKLYTREAPIFDAFSVTSELEKALRPKVWLKSGGYIVINQTEALVAIDVNTGKYVGKSNRLEDTIVKTNTEAIKEIVRQIRLRDLGGIIVIDFIDMDERKNRQKVMQVLEEAMRVDRAPYKILQFNDFGLVAITRKRVKQSLERTLCSPCPHCDGAGYIKSVQTVVTEILAEARKMASSVESKDVMLRVHPDVAKVLKSHQNKFLEELEEVLRRPVLVKSDPLLHHEKFDLA